MARFKKAGAFLTALVITAVSLFVPTFGAAAEGAGDLVPDWFNEDQRTTWWATDSFTGEDNWRFNITVSDGVWTYTQHSNLYDYGHAQSSGTQYDLDLSVNPYLNFVTEMVGESAYISLRCRDGIDGIKNIKVALIQAGKQTVSVDLTQNYDIMKTAGADKKLHLYGVIFTTNKFSAEESLSFKNFRFTSQKETNKNDRYWLDAAADSKWFNWDAGPNSGRFDVYHNPGGFLQLKLRWNGSDMKRLNNRYSTKLIDLNTFTRMHYATPWMEKPVGVYFIIMPFNSDDSVNWNGEETVKVGTIPGGSAGEGYFDLIGNTDLLKFASSGKKLYIKGVELDVSAWGTGDVNIGDLSFRMPDDITADCNFTTSGTRISSNNENDTFTVSAAANYTGTDAVKYQWYVDGVLKENETGADITLDNSTVGSHTVRSVVTVGDITYFNTKFFESETYTYGKYIAGNVSMSGQLGAEDITVLRKNMLGANSFGELQTLAADMNNDTKVDIRDLICLKKVLAE
mgnify:FL=1